VRALPRQLFQPSPFDGRVEGDEHNAPRRVAAENIGGRDPLQQNEMTQKWLMLLVRMNAE
jgi:hypothetical protein